MIKSLKQVLIRRICSAIWGVLHKLRLDRGAFTQIFY